MACNPKCMPLYPFGRGDLFPVFLTWKAAISHMLIDWLCPLLISGIKPARFAKIIKELHINQHACYHLEYEREFMCERRLDPLLTRPEYSMYGNIHWYNGALSSNAYIISSIMIQFVCFWIMK